MTSNTLELFSIPGIPRIVPDDDLGTIIAACMRNANLELQDGDVVVVAQKLVSKAEGRQRRLSEVQPGTTAIELAARAEKEPEIVQLILDESTRILRHRPGVIIAEHKLGMVLANAGIDRSNVDQDRDFVLLFPEAPDASAAKLQTTLNESYGVRIGVVIADSVGRAWRMGTTGLAIGSAGVEALTNLRGQHDLYGRELEVSEHAVADSIAAAAELLMGEADEATPVIVVRGTNQGSSTQDSTVLLRPSPDDMFR